MMKFSAETEGFGTALIEGQHGDCAVDAGASDGVGQGVDVAGDFKDDISAAALGVLLDEPTDVAVAGGVEGDVGTEALGEVEPGIEMIDGDDAGAGLLAHLQEELTEGAHAEDDNFVEEFDAGVEHAVEGDFDERDEGGVFDVGVGGQFQELIGGEGGFVAGLHPDQVAGPEGFFIVADLGDAADGGVAHPPHAWRVGLHGVGEIAGCRLEEGVDVGLGIQLRGGAAIETHFGSGADGGGKGLREADFSGRHRRGGGHDACGAGRVVTECVSHGGGIRGAVSEVSWLDQRSRRGEIPAMAETVEYLPGLAYMG